MTTPTGRCPECGAHLEGSSSLGDLCPRCLLQMGTENSRCSKFEDSTIPHYRILKPLGRGGMGEVYLAEDTHLERRVALKFIAGELQQDEKARRRLLREAKAAAALDHPFICHIHEVTRIRGKDCIVMEYVEGQTLRERLRLLPLCLPAIRRSGRPCKECCGGC